MKVMKLSAAAVATAAAILKNGGVVICPTDTVYGFLADASNKKAVDNIYKIKKRPKSKPLSVFMKDFKMARQIADINENQVKVLKKYWPGKYTFILRRKFVEVGPRRKEARPRVLYGLDKKTIALRIPKHAFLQQLLKKINCPLVQTSVNISSQSPLNNIQEIVKRFLHHKNMLIIDGGNLKKAKPSKIIDLTSKKLIKLR